MVVVQPDYQPMEYHNLIFTRPESDATWIRWFSRLANVPKVTFIVGQELWREMPVVQTVRTWTSHASEDLRCVEFWTSTTYARLTDEGRVEVLWTLVHEQSAIRRVHYPVEKDHQGEWRLLDEYATVETGVNVKTVMKG
jgi:hypothetical protein